MKCPACTNVDLLMGERQGVEIDYCPTCRGVRLDRGELDKIIERSFQQELPPPTQHPHGPRLYIHGSACSEGIPESCDLQLPGGDA